MSIFSHALVFARTFNQLVKINLCFKLKRNSFSKKKKKKKKIQWKCFSVSYNFFNKFAIESSSNTVLLFNNTGCTCNLVGWNGDPCVSSGKCTCKNGYTGAKCSSCSSGFYRLSSNQECKGIWYFNRYSNF